MRLANTGRLGLPGPTPKAPFISLPANTGKVPSPPGGGRRETRIPEGKFVPAGVDGKTLTLACGDRPIFDPEALEMPDGEAREALALLVLDALLCEW